MRKYLPQFQRLTINSDLPLIQNEYQKNGIIHIGGFLNSAELRNINNEILQMEQDAQEDLQNHWQNTPVYFFSRNPDAEPMIKNDFASDAYFTESRHGTHVFYEKIEGRREINRIGHGMHLQEKYNQLHQTIYHNPVLNQLLTGIDMLRPICHLSVYIPKLPKKTGSEVNPHQENTFVYTEPQSAVVVWIALEDAYIDNACMWGIPGSNHWPLKYISRVDHVNKTRVFQQISDVVIPAFDAENPLYTPLVAKAGDAFIFHGNFVHCSPANHSGASRKAISMQFIETHDVKYAETNWIQSPNNKYIYDRSC